MNFQQMLYALLMTVVALIVPALLIISPFIVRKLAEMEWFFATVNEGQARSVTWNKKFYRLIMSYSGYCFAGQLDPSLTRNHEEYWEVVKDNRLKIEENWLKKLFSGIYWIGIVYLAEIQRYRMSWIEWGYPKKADGSISTTKGPISHEEIISHILVQSDVYFVKVTEAETSEGIPVDVSFLLTISITNPYKALYRVQNWLEAVTNQTEGTSRVYLGTKQIRELFAPPPAGPEGATPPVGIVGAMSATSSEELAKSLKDRTENFREEFGVHVELVQIQSMEPAGTASAKYRDLLTKKYEAERGAEMVVIGAKAEAERIRIESQAQEEAVNRVIGAVSRIPGGEKIYHSQQIGVAKPRVYVEGDRSAGGGRAIAIPADGND